MPGEPLRVKPTFLRVKGTTLDGIGRKTIRPGNMPGLILILIRSGGWDSNLRHSAWKIDARRYSPSNEPRWYLSRQIFDKHGRDGMAIMRLEIGKTISAFFERSGGRSDSDIAAQAMAFQRLKAEREIASMIDHSSQMVLQEDSSGSEEEATYGVRTVKPISEILKPEHEDLSHVPINSLIKLREDLAKRIAPATPAGTWIAYRANYSRFRYLGAVSVMRWMLFLGIISLVGASVIVVLEPDVLEHTIGSTDSNGGSGSSASNDLTVWAITFSLFMAGIGGAFRGLYEGYQYITRRQYDTTYNTTYVKRFILGLMSGLILVLSLRGISFDVGFEVALAVILPLVGGYSVDIADILLRRIEQALKALIGESSSRK